MNRTAFVGLGNMGLPMAGNLVSAGFPVNGFDSAASAPDDTGSGTAAVERLDSIEQAINGVDLIITMLPDGPTVLEVLDAIGKSAAAGTLIVDCSTIAIEHAHQAHCKAEGLGLQFLDAPVSGGVAGAAAGSLTMMVGGHEACLAAAKPRLEAMATRVILCGDATSGQAAKVCNNMLLATSMIGTCEAFLLGKKLGLDAQTLFDVVSNATGSCWSVNHYCPVPDVGPDSPANRNYAPGFTARMMLKDLSLAQMAAKSTKQGTPLGQHALKLYQAFAEAGGDAKDFSGIIEFLDDKP